MKRNNYDRIAGAYDFLSRLVFFNTQVNAQIEQLSYIPAGSSILIVGGGTGWILEEIAKIHPAGLKITYVEISENMIEIAKRRSCGTNQITFVLSDIESYHYPQDFDVIHTAFLFDNFEESRAISVFQLLAKHLKCHGFWLYSDFRIEPGKSADWKRLMLRMMYLFFSIIAHVEARKLPAMEGLFARNGFTVRTRKAYYKGFIESIIFQKSGKLPTFIQNLES